MPLEGQVVDGVLPTPLQDLVIAGQDIHVETFLTGSNRRPGLQGLAWSFHPTLMTVVGDSVFSPHPFL